MLRFHITIFHKTPHTAHSTSHPHYCTTTTQTSTLSSLPSMNIKQIQQGPQHLLRRLTIITTTTTPVLAVHLSVNLSQHQVQGHIPNVQLRLIVPIPLLRVIYQGIKVVDLKTISHLPIRVASRLLGVNSIQKINEHEIQWLVCCTDCFLRLDYLSTTLTMQRLDSEQSGKHI